MARPVLDDRYALDDLLIGRGGMGEVWGARAPPAWPGCSARSPKPPGGATATTIRRSSSCAGRSPCSIPTGGP